MIRKLSFIYILLTISFNSSFILKASEPIKCLNDYMLEKNTADKLYNEGQYDKSIQIYKHILSKHGISPEVFYNLGNCYYRLDSMAFAILYYEKSLKLDPSDNDVRTNLSITRSKIKDKSSEGTTFFILAWWYSLINKLSLYAWKIIGFSLFFISILLLVIWKTKIIDKYSKLLKYSAIILLILSIISNFAAWQQYELNTNTQSAIITSQEIHVKGSPSNSSVDLFILHSGARVRVLDDSMKEWCEIEFEVGKSGWIKKKNIAMI